MERIGYREVLHFHSISQTPLALHFNARSKLKRDHVGEMIKMLSEKNLINDRIKWRPKTQRSVICLEPKMENENGTCVYMCGCRPKMQQNLKPRYFITYQKS